MRKREFVKKLCENFSGMPADLAAEMANEIFEAIAETLERGGKAEIRKFGTFYCSELKPRMLRNPSTGEMLEVPARRVPRFKASEKLRRKVNSFRRR